MTHVMKLTRHGVTGIVQNTLKAVIMILSRTDFIAHRPVATALALALFLTGPVAGAHARATAAGGQQGMAAPLPSAQWMPGLDNALPRRAAPVGQTAAAPAPSVQAAAAPRTLSQLKETDRHVLPATLGAGPFAVELWILDHVNQRVGTLMDTGSAAPGQWVLGYVSGQALFGPTGADGLPVLRVPTGEGYKERWHHLVGVWDGRQWGLYVNGVRQVAVTAAPAPAPAPAPVDGGLAASLTIGGYFENERFMRLPDFVKAAALYDRALSEGEVRAVFDRRARLVEEGRLTDMAPHFTQPPYLNAPTSSSIELSWEADRPIAASVEWGETADSLKKRRFAMGKERLGGLTLDGLRPDTPYFYRVSGVDADGKRIDSGLLSFRSAPLPGAPFTIAISADTEARTHINRRMSELIWEERPNLLLLAGDLTDGGYKDKRFEWTHEYFAGMGPLFGRVPVIAAAGNGEGELHWFRHYHRQPGDEAFFSHRYGDVEIFVLDSNLTDREAREPGFRARQKSWLAQALAASTARWKIAMHHHALMSTDEDDYGNSWTGKSQGGDTVVTAEFQPLYEQYGVDLVVVGHLHAYERSWPMRGGKVDQENGVTYVQLGGMGGNLEDFQPTKPGFNRKAFRDHHYLMLRGAGDRLEAEAIDAQGNRRDAFVLTKR